MGSDTIISDHIALGIILFLAVGFGILWRKFEIFGFWSFIIFLIILIIAWILFF